MVPPDTKELLRKQISDRNPAMAFVQGFAGIAGVIVAQVQAAHREMPMRETGLAVTYDPRTRTVDLYLERPEDVQVIAWWGTSFTPPEPRSTSLVLVDAGLPAGQHTVTLPGEVPRRRHSSPWPPATRCRRSLSAHARRDDHGIRTATADRTMKPVRQESASERPGSASRRIPC